MAVSLIPGNLLTLEQQDMETNTSGAACSWALDANCTLAQSSAQSFGPGGTNSLAITAVTGAAVYTKTFPSPGFTVLPSTGYIFSGWFRTTGATPGVACSMYIQWFTGASAHISDSGIYGTTDNNTTWSQGVSQVVTSPSNAALAFLSINLATPGAGDVHYADYLYVGLPPSTTAFRTGWW